MVFGMTANEAMVSAVCIVLSLLIIATMLGVFTRKNA